MPREPVERVKESGRSGGSALRIALVYAAFGFLWILFSDRILAVIVHSPEMMTRVQTLKGWLYVGVSAWLIYLLVRVRLRKIEELNRSLQQRQQQLQESEAKYRELFENLVDVNYQTDAQGRFTIISPSVQDLFGYSPAEVLGKQIGNFYRDPACRARFVAQLRRDGWVKNFEAEIRKRDGTYVWVSTNARALLDENAELAGVEGVTRDISPLKKAEEEKQQLAETLRQSQKMEAIGTLAGGIAHDFNNILSAVQGYTELVKERLPRGGEDREHLETVLAAAHRAKELTQQILLFSRKGPKKNEPVPISRVVEEAVRLLRNTLPTTVRLQVEIDEATGTVSADATELHQIVLNVCTNAYHALHHEDGEIHIELRPVQVDQAMSGQYPNLREGPYALFEVRDTGSGMDPLTMARIFEPFFTTKEYGKGTGMGLAVVHGIVQSCGGAIGVESELGSGSTFKVFLPLADAEGEARTKGEAVPARGSERVLFVDDEPVLVRLGEKVLASLGYRVFATSSPKQALEEFRRDPRAFDLIVSDQTMPEMSGNILAREAMRLRPGMPVILCTGYSSVLDGEQAREAGIRAVLMKPVAKPTLAATLRKVLDEGV